MYHKEFSPNARLKPFIRSYFFISVKLGNFHFPADGCPGLIINFGEPLLLGFEHEHLTKFSGCRLFGSQTRNLLTKYTTGQTDLLAVKFNPGQITRFLNIPAIELTDTSVSTHVLWGKFGNELEQRFLETKRILQIVRLLDDTFIKFLSNEKSYDDRVSVAQNTIWSSKGQVRIGDLAKALGFSRRHLDRLFLEYVGLTPKRMSRIVRFLSIFSFLKANQSLDWADLAIASGYSDQAHLIRECKYFTGRSPLTYLKNRSSLEHAVTGTADTMSHFFNTSGLTSYTMPQK
jgi:AraC-like DNA-binding protein